MIHKLVGLIIFAAFGDFLGLAHICRRMIWTNVKEWARAIVVGLMQ